MIIVNPLLDRSGEPSVRRLGQDRIPKVRPVDRRPDKEVLPQSEFAGDISNNSGLRRSG